MGGDSWNLEVDESVGAKAMRWLVGISVGILVMMGWIWWQWPENQVVVTMCDVGQGDGIVFVQGKSQLVVDVGRDDGLILGCLGEEVPFWDKNIEAVVITHADSDHLGGLVRLLDAYKVKKIITTDEAKVEVNEIVSDRVQVITSLAGDRWSWGNVWFEVLWPQVGFRDSKETNDVSLVMRAEFVNGKSMWLAGDAGEKVERELIKNQKIIATEVLKVAHHGSSTATTKPFLELLQPRQVWISVGKNDYGHPAEQVLRLFEEMKAVVKRTDKLGKIQWWPESTTFPQ